jgi:hypothetical protein
MDNINFNREDFESMNIYALKGHKVKVTEQSSISGWDGDSEKVKKHLEIGKEYTVEKTHVHQSSTDVFLQEFPDMHFNSVNFVDVKPKSEEDNKKHLQYKMYNRITKPAINKVQIKVAKSKTIVNTEEVEIELPTNSQYFIDTFSNEDRLFAVLFIHERYFIIIEITYGKQDYTDFNPFKDCKSDFFIKGNHLRKEALELFEKGEKLGFKPISKIKFNKLRKELLSKIFN